ncbi:MAG: thioesterase family protein [Planctomycetota bacterium]
METSITVPLQVRYCECDPMNVAHHSTYAVWFEIARTELLRKQGSVYAQLEKDGILFVVAKLSTRFRRPAYYDDQLEIEVTVQRSAGVKIEHVYRVLRSTESGKPEVLAVGETTLACVDRDGKLRPVPDALLDT